jgi:hypothetical protein
MRLAKYCLALTTLFSGVSAARAVDPNAQLHYVLAGLRAREASLRFLSGTAVEHVMQTPAGVVRQRMNWQDLVRGAPEPPLLPADAERLDSTTAVRFAAAKGRFRQYVLVLTPGPSAFHGLTVGPAVEVAANKDRVVAEVTVRDGVNETRYQPHMQMAQIREQVTWPGVCAAPPISGELLIGLGSQSFSQFIYGSLLALGHDNVASAVDADRDSLKHRYRYMTAMVLSGTETVGGYPCWRIDATALTPEPYLRSDSTLWVAESLGFAVKKWCVRRYRASDAIDSEEQHEGDRWKEVSRDLWLPDMTTHTESGHVDKGGLTLCQKRICRWRDLATTPLGDSSFTVDLPIGTYVQNNGTRKCYWVGDISPETSPTVVAADRGLEATPDASKP